MTADDTVTARLAEWGADMDRRVPAADPEDRDIARALLGFAREVRAIHFAAPVLTWLDDCADPERHEAMVDPHGGGMLCADEPLGTYCDGCAPEDATDVYEYPWPCPTAQAARKWLGGEG